MDVHLKLPHGPLGSIATVPQYIVKKTTIYLFIFYADLALTALYFLLFSTMYMFVCIYFYVECANMDAATIVFVVWTLYNDK